MYKNSDRAIMCFIENNSGNIFTFSHQNIILCLLITLMILAIFTGCGTLVHGTEQVIKTDSKPKAATVTVDGKKSGKTPCHISMTRRESHTVSIQAEGYEEERILVKSSVSRATALNCCMGLGALGIVVDLATGGAYQLRPDSIYVVLQPTETAPDQKERGSPIVGKREEGVWRVERVNYAGSLADLHYGAHKYKPTEEPNAFWMAMPGCLGLFGGYSTSTMFRINEDDTNVFSGLGRDNYALQAIFPTYRSNKSLRDAIADNPLASAKLKEFDSQVQFGEKIIILGRLGMITCLVAAIALENEVLLFSSFAGLGVMFAGGYMGARSFETLHESLDIFNGDIAK